MEVIAKQVYDKETCVGIFGYLDNLEVEYRKPYMRFGKMVEVPRGQASFTLSSDIHYDYKVSGGSPPNIVMCEKLKEIICKIVKKHPRKLKQPRTQFFVLGFGISQVN